MDQPEATLAAANHIQAKEVMTPPHEPASAQQNGASGEVLASIWPTTKLSGFSKGENVANGGVEHVGAIPKGAQLQKIPEIGRESAQNGSSAPLQASPSTGEQATPTENCLENVETPAEEHPCAVRPDLTAAQKEAITELDNILSRISQLDAEGWFQMPVTDELAPNYRTIIKKPMCFSVSVLDQQQQHFDHH